MPVQQAARLGLDARAAELKEKLIKSRGQNQSRGNPTTPTTITDPAPSSSGHPSSARFIPHEIPRQPPETSIPADASDIAALIASISSSATEMPGPSTSTQSNDAHSLQAQQAKTANGQPSLPSEPSPVILAPVPDVPRTATPQTKQTKQSDAAVPESPIKFPFIAQSPSDNEHSLTDSKTARTSQRGGQPVNLERPASKTAVVENTKVQAESATEAKQPTTKQHLHERIYRENGTNPNAVASKPAIRNSKVGEELKAVTDNSNSNDAGQRRPCSTSDPVSSDEIFIRLLSQHPDLRDWLEITDYYNVEARTRRLDRFRKAKALAAQRLKIEEEERKLMEEEALEMGLQRPTVVRLVSGVSTQAAPLQPSPTPSPSLACRRCDRTFSTRDDLMGHVVKDHSPPRQKPRAGSGSSAVRDIGEATQATPAKRSHNQDGDDSRKGKVPRLVETPRLGDGDSRPREDDRRETGRLDLRRASESDKVGARPPPVRGSSPLRRPAPHPVSPPRRDYRRSPPPRLRDYSPHRPPRSAPLFRDYDDSDDRPRKYDSFRGDKSGVQVDFPRRRDSVAAPIRIDLGRKGDTRFFILKSFNEDNVRACMEDSLWTTQVQNGEILSEAFAKCKNVILFFSINKSRAFQGYARMTSAPSPDTPRPSWVSGIHWDTSDPFRVQWLSKTSVEFFRIGHLKNAYNDGQPVLVGKDGQEIEEGCGTELLREMEAFAESLWRDQRDSGPSHGGVYAGRYVKRERERSPPDRRW
ncbi:YTH domain-containing protein 1 [Madurella fahalii]|uniref:YTH domain-containing protein 1 n=1 Tax=Madurella fahalii TaxID=1157608 RepID=A0ABQ0GDP7_9PEZI